MRSALSKGSRYRAGRGAICSMVVGLTLLASCSGAWKYHREASMGLRIRVPKTWQVGGRGTLVAPDGFSLTIRVTRDRNPLAKVATATRSSIPDEIPTFSVEGDGYRKVQGRRAWYIKGSYQAGSAWKTSLTVVVDYNKLKYFFTFYDHTSRFAKRKQLIEQILRSLLVSAEIE